MQKAQDRSIVIDYDLFSLRSLGFLFVRSAADGRHDVLNPGVVREAVHGQVLAVTRVLEASARHLRELHR
jgi:hypothetical protein